MNFLLLWNTVVPPR